MTRVVVVGAGIVGLSTAWFLHERGGGDVEVTVLERAHPGAGASWGNAGWLTPSRVTPLPDPAVLRYGLRTLLDPAAPLYVPPRLDPGLWRWLLAFARHCTPSRHRAALRVLAPLARAAFGAFDELGLPTTEAAPFLACFAAEHERREVLAELDEMRRAGVPVEAELLDGDQARALAPVLGPRVTAALSLRGQRFLDPPAFVRELAAAVRARGVVLRGGVAVHEIADEGTGVVVRGAGEGVRADAVVLATGTWLGELAAPFGVRVPVRAGRGYSFTVVPERMPDGPVYLPAQRVACTPLPGRLRIAGTMEFRRPGEPVDPRRVAAIADSVRPFLSGVDLAERREVWVGSRPCTPDGLPLVGRTASPRVLVAGGHGMWGVVLGPLTGRIVADTLVTGAVPREAAALDPLRPAVRRSG